MNGYAIVKLEADALAAKENIVQHFNEYMQREQHSPSFIRENEGYFRLTYDEKIGISSAAIETFGKFLQSSGYTVSGIRSAGELENSTDIVFSKGGEERRVLLSTVNIY